ncbi:GGDEF domain-containing protein [Turicibacter bilis]|uniref:GGDEF domain-containing protein n=1 Tax=Turicibacter bilis TaxID=2735723 RepID=UPI0031BA5E06
MKVKAILIGAIGIILLFGILLTPKLKTILKTTPSDEFIQLMYDGGGRELTQEQLKQYKDDINQELIKLKHRQSFGKIYLSLGKIASLEEAYEDSNNYLLNVISPGSHTNKMIDLKVYETLAVNYIAMGDIEKGYFYFNEANNVAYQLRDAELVASFYQLFSETLLNYTNHTNFPIYLLGEAVELTNDYYKKVQLRKELASVYGLGGFSDLAINELIKALDMSVEEGYEDLEIEILSQLSLLYYSNQQYQDSMRVLNRYFELSTDNPDLIYLSLWIQNYYYLYGYESIQEELKSLEEATSNLSIEQKIQYLIFIDFNQAFFLHSDGRYEECEMYIRRLQELKTQTTVSDLTSLLIDKMKLDLEYDRGNQEIDYVKEYRQLLSDLQLTNDSVERKRLMIDNVLLHLLELGDYETVYQYTADLQKPVNQEVRAISFIMAMIQNSDNSHYLSKNNITSMVLKLGGYLLTALAGMGVTYGAYRYSSYFKSLKRKAKESTIFDPLTKTLTKEALYETLELEIELGHNELYYFLLIDVNDLSSYNESFGYLAGDKVLIEISNLLKIYFPNAYISRHYGQHFIVVIKKSNEEELLKLITSLINEISNNEKISAKRPITCCIGVSKGYLTNTLDIDEQIKLATKKLQISKQRGTGSCTM